MVQDYSKYTAEDFKVWKLLYERLMPHLPGAAVPEYLEGVRRVGFSADRIPSFEETNKALQSSTGWRLEVVPGLIPDKDFFELLADRRFPASTWLRKLSELDYLEEPDMFHDVFGHVPLLTNADLVSFLQALSKIALNYIGDADAIESLSRIYWFTVEFGLIRRDGELRIYGAGILSSRGETQYSLHDTKPTRHPFQVDLILDTPFRKDEYQKEYFIIDDFNQLADCIPELDKAMRQRHGRGV